MRFLIPSSRIKIILVALLISLAGASFVYNQILVNRIMEQERKNVELWARAFQHNFSRVQQEISQNLTMAAREIQKYEEVPDSLSRLILEAESAAITNDFVQKEIILAEDLFNIPVILADESGFAIGNRFIEGDNYNLDALMKQFAELHDPIIIEFGHDDDIRHTFVYYGESPTIRYLRFFPYVQVGILALLLGVGYTTYRSITRSEQSNLWVGMAREAAHQLGTPLSSIYGWLQLLQDKSGDDQDVISITYEIENDVQRLRTIAERFNKIGSQPELKLMNIELIVDEVITYMERRLPQLGKQIEVRKSVSVTSKAEVNPDLFKWAIENLIKNAMDAIQKNKERSFVSIDIRQEADFIIIDVEDSGSGIEKKYLKEVFRPGFSTRKRGWGLGLSLTRRIIEDYHKGKIYVHSSEVDKGTVMRIELPV